MLDLSVHPQEIVIDPAFKAHIPPLGPDERAQLEQNLRQYGCRDPLVLWRRADAPPMLLDGYNRHEICTGAGIGFDVVYVDCADRAAAEDWIDANQLGRRNLSPDAFRLLLGRRYNRQKRQGARTDLTSPQAEEKSTTADRLADDHGVSRATVERAGRFASEVEASPALQEAVVTGEPVAKVKQRLKRQAAVARGTEIAQGNVPLEPSDRRYQVIYADPAWTYEPRGEAGHGRSASNHYPTMSLEEICDLEVGAMASDDCALFLWACWPNLADAFDVIRAWGFCFSTLGFIWIKTNNDGETPFMGNGYWTRANSEPCLLATRGSPVRLDAGVSEVIMAPRMEHSRKPDEAYGLIERLVPGPYLELFARRPREDWDAWGNQAGGVSP